MTLFDLYEDFRRLMGYKNDLDSEMLSLINRAQDRVSQDLKIPRRMDSVSGATPLLLPSASWPDGLLGVYDTVQRKNLPLYMLGEATLHRPGWSEIGADVADPEYVVYGVDPAIGQIKLYIIPPQSVGRAYKVYYVERPSALSALSGVPFNGTVGLDEAHYLIPLWATWLAGRGESRQEYLYELQRLRPQFFEQTGLPSNPYLESWLGFSAVDTR